jgi:hypothetical protein
MRPSRLALLLVLLSSAKSALAQAPAPIAPAAEPAPPPSVQPAPMPEASPPPAQESEPAPSTPLPESAPAPEKTPELAPGPAPAALPKPGHVEPAQDDAVTPPEPAWVRAHSPLTLEGRLGFLVRPDSGMGFDEETNVGAELGLSLYADLKRELAVGLEVERVSLGRGTAISGLDSVSIDYTVSSAMLGLRAYPKRTELFDVFVGFQLGVGIQGVSAGGTANNGGVLPASAYTCSAADVPAFQLGGGVGARLMLSPRWGLSARINGTGRRLTNDVIEDCANGIGTATTVSASFGLGYDFDLDP